MAVERTLTDHILLFIKGIAMGAANKIPGVSGGMVAFVTGFYEELIYSLQKVNKKAFRLLFNGRFKSFYRYINGKFLLLVFAGSTFSYFSISRVLDFFLTNYDLYVWSAFFGLIIGSIYYIVKDFNDWNTKTIIAMALGAALGIAISFMSPARENDNLWFVFLCGMIGVSGMTLPGLSGSFILILLGNYVLLLVDSVNELYKTIADILRWNFEFIHDPERMQYMKIISSFTLGSITGLVVSSHILGYLLKHWHQIVTAVIIGFITGSLGIVWPWKNEVYKIDETGAYLYDSLGNRVIENYNRFIPDLHNSDTWIAIGYIIFGIVILVVLEWYGRNNDSKLKPKV
jgi:uncharacterized membrane protein